MIIERGNFHGDQDRTREDAEAETGRRRGTLGFGKYYTDHMFVLDWDKDQGWHDARIVPFAPIPLDPATMVLHYAQETFEGLKAYRTKDGRILLFRRGDERQTLC